MMIWRTALRAARGTGPEPDPEALAVPLDAGFPQTTPPLARRISEHARRVGPAGPSGGPLTARESEVLRLPARGRSNREIAEELVISPKTTGVHVSSILAEFGVASRGEAAAAARDRGPA